MKKNHLNIIIIFVYERHREGRIFVYLIGRSKTVKIKINLKNVSRVQFDSIIISLTKMYKKINII